MTAPRRVPTEVERTAGHVHLGPLAGVIARLGVALEESRREVQRLHADNDRLRQQIKGGHILGARPAPECLTSHPQMHADCDGCTCSCHPPISFADQLIARHGQPMRDALDRARVRYEADKAAARQPRRRWWHRLTRRNP